TCAVGSYASGAFGLKDMAGNVWEWVQDWYGAYPSSTSKNHAGPSSGSYRVCRGGGWGRSDPSGLRGAGRLSVAPGRRDIGLGFRCARTR
ncbi:MAG TPA: SUMF1/EgtB/PvdO family nonheme iron enzyme, partial [Polyangiaceae bacterium]|nr:SUMF1/EgtB/PvdO family nonheme iron enzyme [Polyangiaceae bacterium]